MENTVHTTEHLLVGLSSIIVLGIGAQWLAWRYRFPSLLLLLALGFAVGPASGFIDPDALFGKLLFPFISISVAIILFEGGLNLRVIELDEIGSVLRNLVTLGALATWCMTSVAALILLNMALPLAILVGAMLVVSGPTVVGPLLRHVRPSDRVGSMLKWEGILIDPIGVLLAALVFEVILVQELHSATLLVLTGALKMAVIGSILGFLCARLFILMLQRYWIPDYLQNPVALMLVLGIFTAADLLQPEAGLFAVTVMGMTMANQKRVSIQHIVEFKEVLQVLLISTLFILLTARIQIPDLMHLGMPSLMFLGVLLIIVRPVAVALSALGSELSWQERAFLAWVAPRGIVAAAMASIFAIRLHDAGYAGSEQLVSVTFLVIVGTVAVYGLTAAPVARWLGVAQKNPQGVLFVGAFRLAREMAKALKAEGYQTLLIDTNWTNIAAARMEGLSTYYGSALREETVDKLNLDGIGRLVALTSNDEANALAALHFAEIFGRNEVYQLVPGVSERTDGQYLASHLRGRFLFGPQITYTHLLNQLTGGAVIKVTPLSEQFDYEAFQTYYGNTIIPLFLITEAGQLQVFTVDQTLGPEAGQSLLSLVPPEADALKES
jgi:NhaP-type Na+/H+ or K+/H+ antiporter